MTARLISKMVIVFGVFLLLVWSGVQAAHYADTLATESAKTATTIESILSE